MSVLMEYHKQSKEELIATLQEMEKRIKILEHLKQDDKVLYQQLQESEERFRQVTDNINEVFWMTDPGKNNMFFISKAYERIWGKTCQSQLEEPLSFVESIYPADRAFVIAAFPKQIEGTYDIEYRIINAKGEIRWIHDKAFPIANKEGEIYRVVGVAQDITENKKLIENLKEEQEKTEYLLENILPKSIIEELKHAKLISINSPAIAQKIDHSTVLFADIVGFTSYSRSLAAECVVSELNKLFRLFDELVDKYRVEKIKTIGDCYMLAGGVPDYQEDHACRVANAALEMIQKLEQFNQEEKSHFQIRIGIHSGPLVAGVIGTKKYIYDIWGDTVNTASRMESGGLPGKIQVSEDTYNLLKDRYRFTERGFIEVKGKGQLKTFFLEGVIK